MLVIQLLFQTCSFSCSGSRFSLDFLPSLYVCIRAVSLNLSEKLHQLEQGENKCWLWKFRHTVKLEECFKRPIWSHFLLLLWRPGSLGWGYFCHEIRAVKERLSCHADIICFPKIIYSWVGKASYSPSSLPTSLCCQSYWWHDCIVSAC